MKFVLLFFSFVLITVILYLLCVLAAMDERLSSYALIARAAIDAAVPLLTRLFSERFAQLHQVLLVFIYKRIYSLSTNYLADWLLDIVSSTSVC